MNMYYFRFSLVSFISLIFVFFSPVIFAAEGKSTTLKISSSGEALFSKAKQKKGKGVAVTKGAKKKVIASKD